MIQSYTKACNGIIQPKTVVFLSQFYVVILKLVLSLGLAVHIGEEVSWHPGQDPGFPYAHESMTIKDPLLVMTYVSPMIQDIS